MSLSCAQCVTFWPINRLYTVTPAWSFLALVIVASAVPVGVWLLAFERGRTSANPQIEWLRKELAQANDRLYNVSLNPAAFIPPRDAEVPAVRFEVLDPQLQAIVDDWDDPFAAEVVARQFRQWRDQGVGVEECVRRHLNS